MILLDRTRWAVWNRCARLRYLEYEFVGTGIRSPQAALPLATGSALHAPIEALLRALQLGKLVDESAVREAVVAAQSAYRERCSVGFQHGVQSHETDYVVAEQCALIEGSAWAFWSDVLPWIKDEFEILEVEQEHDLPISCDCGLGVGVGSRADHEARKVCPSGASHAFGNLLHGDPACDTCGYTFDAHRKGCAGVLAMVRPDFVTRRYSDGSIGTWDVKSTGYGLDKKQNEHSVQMSLGCMAVEKDRGEPVQHYYLLGILKGKRDFPNRERTGLKHQYSPFCYAWMKPGDATFNIKEEWSSTYTSKKGFAKVPVWEAYFSEKPEGVSNAEWWTREYLTKEQRKAQFGILGPCQRPQHLETGWRRQVDAIEQEIQGRLELLDRVAELGVDDWEAALDQNFPQSWNCFPYGSGAGGCQMLPICHRDPGTEWSELLTSGRYVRREPHHAQESEEQE